MAGATLSLSTNAFAEDDLPDALHWAGRLGLKAVEIGPRHAAMLHGAPDLAAEAADALRRGGVRMGSLHAWAQVDGLAEVCPTAHALGAGLVVVHCGHERLTQDFDATVATVRRWTGWCAERGVQLTVENSSIQPLEPFVRLFDAVDGLGLTLDVKHAYKPQRLGLMYEDYFARLADRVMNFHVSGVDPSRDVLGDGVPPGRDRVDWQGLNHRLRARRYAGLITIEWHLPTYLPEVERQAAYADIAAHSAEETTLSRRLSRYAVDFFAEQFAAVLDPAP
jgi:sugar phosphate isomerase/epimerase